MRYFILASLVLVIIVSGCSQNSSPTTPESIPDSISDAEMLIQPQNRGLFGAWKVRIDTDTLEAEIIPARNAQVIGDVFDADLYQFLNVSPCANCMRIARVRYELYEGLSFGLQIKHPFGNIATRPDLHGFDVRAIFLGDTYTVTNPSIMVMDLNGEQQVAEYSTNLLANADGFTSHFDDVVSDPRYFIGGSDMPGNINPFLRFFDDPRDIAFDPHSPEGHNVIPVGSGYEERTAYIGALGCGGTVEFYIVADVAYGHSATYLNRDNPHYFLPWFHRTEPWRIEYYVENNNLDSTNTASTAELVVQVFDWQHGATVDPDYPDPTNLSGIPEGSDCALVEVSFPGLQNDLLQLATPESGTGAPDNPLEYRFVITNENGASALADGIIAVRDELYGQSGRMAIPELPAGFPYDTSDILDYSLYKLIRINIPYPVSSNYPWGYEIEVDSSCLYTSYGTVSIRANHISDFTGKMYQYFWDYDYDGVTFDNDGEGNPSPEITLTDTGIVNVGMRVVTTTVPAQEYIYTIPLYYDGEEFRGNVSPSADLVHSTSINRQYALGMTDDAYYFVFTSEEDGNRDVWLSSIDSSGNETSVNLTGSIANPCFFPSICVVEDGVNDGIYVSFIRFTGSAYELCSTYGNLDTTGFDPGNIRQITTSGGVVIRMENMIFHFDGALYIYYFQFTGMGGGRIRVASSVDMGDTWVLHGDINTTPAMGTYLNPSIAMSSTSSVAYCVWSDNRDYSNSGSDLFMAYSTDLINFTEGENISVIPGNADENYPAIDLSDSNLAIAYLVEKAPDQPRCHVQIRNRYTGGTGDVELKVYPGLYHTRPSITSSVKNRYMVALGSHHTGSLELYASVVEVSDYSGIGNIQQDTKFAQNIGTIVADIEHAQIFPGIISRAGLWGKAQENFIVFRSFAYGSQMITNPFDWYFGQITAMTYISGGDVY